LIDLTYIKDLDKHWMDYSVDFIRKMKDATVLPLPRDARVSFR